MKHNQRLVYQRLAEVLTERGLVEPQAVQDALEMSTRGGLPFPEALVTANLVADWELSRTVCELYNLPFLPIEMIEPDPEAAVGLDPSFLQENALIPMGRHGMLLTVCMPAIVPAEVLGYLAAASNCTILPVVGTVRSNRRWIEENLDPAAAMTEAAHAINLEAADAATDEWSQFFDEADAAVLSDIEHQLPELEPELEPEPAELEPEIPGLAEGSLPAPAQSADQDPVT